MANLREDFVWPLVRAERLRSAGSDDVEFVRGLLSFGRDITLIDARIRDLVNRGVNRWEPQVPFADMWAEVEGTMQPGFLISLLARGVQQPDGRAVDLAFTRGYLQGLSEYSQQPASLLSGATFSLRKDGTSHVVTADITPSCWAWGFISPMRSCENADRRVRIQFTTAEGVPLYSGGIAYQLLHT